MIYRAGHRDTVRWGPFVQGDILKPADLDQAFKRYQPKSVIHFAALAYVGDSVAQPLAYYQNNVSGLINVLDAIVRHGADTIVFSKDALLMVSRTLFLIVAMKPANKAKEANCGGVCGGERSGVGGAKGGGQGEYASAQHVLDPEPGARVTNALERIRPLSPSHRSMRMHDSSRWEKVQDADARDFPRLLRARRQRRRYHRAAKREYEFSPSSVDCPITASRSAV
jgi:hypothetical protein